jgi:hypothetical protein
MPAAALLAAERPFTSASTTRPNHTLLETRSLPSVACFAECISSGTRQRGRFAECRTRQINTHGKSVVCRVFNTRQR